MEWSRSATRRCWGSSKRSVWKPGPSLDHTSRIRRWMAAGQNTAAYTARLPPLECPPQPELAPRVLPGRRLDVGQGLFLGRDLRHTGHLQILPPAGQGVVGAPEGEVHRPVPGLRGQGRELLPLGRVHLVQKAAQLHPAKPPGGRHPLQHLRDLIRDQDPQIDLLPFWIAGEKGLCRRLQRHRPALARRGQDAPEIHIAQLRQDQIVHFIKRGLGHRQIPPPVQIVQEIRHGPPSSPGRASPGC